MANITGPRARRSPLRTVRQGVVSQTTPNVVAGLNQSFTSLDEHVIRMRTLRSSPRRRSSILSTGEISLLGSSGMSSDSSFDTSFGSDISSLSMSSSFSFQTPNLEPPPQAEKIRKRLQMSPTKDYDTSLLQGVTGTKRKRSKSTGIRQRLEVLSKDQLVSLAETVTFNHPELKQEIECLLPVPDISPLLENLEFFRHNIYKALPNSRWVSNRDASCYRRVATHLENFRSVCIKQGKQLQDSCSWEALLEYAIKGVDYVNRLPDWDNTAHNKMKLQCMQGLRSMCKSSLKHSNFSKEKYMEIKDRITKISYFAMCLEVVEKKIKEI